MMMRVHMLKRRRIVHAPQIRRLGRESLGHCAVLAFIIALGASAPACAEPVFETDAMSDAELRRYRDTRVAELKRRARETKPEQTPDGTVYRIFYCSIYYTPKESGFTEERGFDVTPVSAPGLRGKTYAQSFLKAVKMEGFGRLNEPVDGRNYIRFAGNGRYAFAKHALGSRGNVLVPRSSCAISTRNPRLRHGATLKISSPTLLEVTGSAEWFAGDTGGGVHPLQIDLYWGEDEPMGPVGRQLARPAGTRMEYAFDVVVTVK